MTGAAELRRWWVRLPVGHPAQQGMAGLLRWSQHRRGRGRGGLTFGLTFLVLRLGTKQTLDPEDHRTPRAASFVPASSRPVFFFFFALELSVSVSLDCSFRTRWNKHCISALIPPKSIHSHGTFAIFPSDNIPLSSGTRAEPCCSVQASESRLYAFSQETKDHLRKFRLGTSRSNDPQAVICEYVSSPSTQRTSLRPTILCETQPLLTLTARRALFARLH